MGLFTIKNNTILSLRKRMKHLSRKKKEHKLKSQNAAKELKVFKKMPYFGKRKSTMITFRNMKQRIAGEL